MKYIGNKKRLLGFIEECMSSSKLPSKGVFLDLFTGTTNVANHFKQKGYKIISNDFMTYSYVLQKVYIELNEMPRFSKVDGGIDFLFDHLNSLKPIKGYAYSNYAPGGNFRRQYFTDYNAMMIDSIREEISNMKVNRKISNAEYYVLLSSLIDAADHVANIAGTYGAYLKIWRPTALKKILLVKPSISSNESRNKVYKKDANKLAMKIESDITYIDPPYNSRQYAPNFHVLESIAVWDKQVLSGKTGLRDYEHQKSRYSYKNKSKDAFRELILNLKTKYIVVSYSNEGIITKEEMVSILKQRGSVKQYDLEYKRFRTERNHSKRIYRDVGDKVSEFIYIVKVIK